MFRWGKYILMICIFITGWLVCAGYDYYSELSKEQPYSISGVEVYSPGDWIEKEDIKAYDSRVILKIPNAKIAGFTDTNSMDPVIDENANSIEIMPSENLKVGDIISYNFGGRKVIHRIVNISEDKEGMYYVVKGDNNLRVDKEKVRFEQISGVVVGILY